MSRNLYTYVHWNNENFKRYYLKLDHGKTNYADRTKRQYTQLANEAQRRIQVFKDAAPDTAYLVELLQELGHEDFMQSISDSVSANLVKKLRESVPESFRVASIVRKKIGETEFVNANRNPEERVVITQELKVKQLNEFLNQMDDILQDITRLDNQYAAYAVGLVKGSNAEKSFRNMFGVNPEVLNINENAVTAKKSLMEKVTKLRRVAKQTTDFSATTITYHSTSKNKQVTRTVADAVASIHSQITNIMGGIGEAVIGMKLTESIQEVLGELNRVPNITFYASGGDNIEGTNRTSISDIRTNTVTLDAKGDKVFLGISIKAYNIEDMKKKKNPGRGINFSRNTTLRDLLMVNAARFNVNDKYLLYNMLYNNWTSNTPPSGLPSYALMNRQLASLSFDINATGYGLKDRVLFFGFIDRIVDIHEFYSSIVDTNPMNRPNFSIKGVRGVKKDVGFYKGTGWREARKVLDDKNPAEKNALAWARSKAVVNAYLALKAEIYFNPALTL